MTSTTQEPDSAITNARKLYTLGPKGTFSNQAASLVGGSNVQDIRYTVTIPQIVHEVINVEDALGVMPIENSIAGAVAQAQDSLIDSNVIIISELQIEIRFSLVASVPLNEVKIFYAHAEAFNQTMLFTTKYLTGASVVFSNSNIHSGELFLERQNEPVAAIIPKPLADKEEPFKNIVAADNIQDYENNLTRFVVIAKKPNSYIPDFSKSKTSLCIELKEDRHSLLFELLREFHVYEINLCRLESRPAKNTPWRYMFFIDLLNNHRVEKCLEELKRLDIDVKLFGSYNPIDQS